VWTTDKDGIVPALLSAEITAHLGQDIGDIYQELENELGKTFFEQDDVKATREQKEMLKKISSQQIKSKELAGEKIETILTNAPGNKAPIDGIKITTKGGWVTMRPSGTEEIYRIYAESFYDQNHLDRLLAEAQAIVNQALESMPKSDVIQTQDEK
jgi:phosphoglucomutase